MNEALGTISVSWDACQVDGCRARPLSSLRPGMIWRWSGQRNSFIQRSQIGYRAEGLRAEPFQIGQLNLALGNQVFRGEVIQRTDQASPEVQFQGAPPPAARDLMILDFETERTARDKVICFVAGTPIETINGPELVEAIRPGHRLWTRDDGFKEVLWVGRRRVSGATLASVPALRPVPLAPGVLVSPGHRVLRTEDEETLVPARDLHPAKRGVLLPKGLVYVHILLEQHGLLRTGGVDSESFHPASMPLGRLGAGDRAALIDILPDVATAPERYGPLVRPLQPISH